MGICAKVPKKVMNKGVYEKFRERAEELIGKLTLDEKCGLLSTHQLAVERLGLSELFVGTEVARGYVGRDKERISTVFPQPEGLAATFDRNIMEQLGEIAGNEARAYYNQDKNCDLALWGPTVDLARDPRWGRNEESYGEDPCLTGTLSAAYTKGMAGDDGTYYKTIPTLKHFCADNNEEHRADCNAVLPLHLKYEYYYKAFEYPIRKGGAKSMMAAYNEINGVPGLLNPELRTKIKDEWGLWYVVSDGGDFTQNMTAHHYVDSHAESFALSIKAGADLMTDNGDCVAKAAKKALAEGLLTEAELDESLANSITARFILGQFDEDCKHNDIKKDVIDCDEYKKINKKASMEQVVLLKNDGILPLKEEPKKIAVVGAMADENLMDWYTGYSSGDHSVLFSAKDLMGSEVTYDTLWDRVAVMAPNGKYWSVKEDGIVVADADEIGEDEIFEHQKWGENWNNFFSVKHQRYIRLMDDNTFRLHNRRVYEWFTRETIVESEVKEGFIFEEWLHRRRLFTDESGKLSVKKTSTITPDTIFKIVMLESGEERAAKIAKENDFVLYCVGNHPTQVAKECYDRKTLKLNIQENMALKLLENNKNTVMAVISSYPYSINDEQAALPAIIWSSHAGAYLGDAIIETITGKNNPAGRLSQTWYKTEKDLPSIMNYDIEKGGSTYMYFKGEPLYPFGHGLSYSSFDYSDLDVAETNDTVEITLHITNTSEVSGDEVIQVYFAKADSEVSRPIKKLCGFTRVNIAAGETKSVSVLVDKEFLEIYDTRSGRFLLESGEYEFLVGASSGDIRLSKKLILDGEKLGLREGKIEAESFDDSTDIVINYSKKNAAHYIVGTGWTSNAVYDGVDFAGKSCVKLDVAAVGGKGRVILEIDGEEVASEVVEPTDGYNDIICAEVKLPEGIKESGSLTIGIRDGVVLYSYELV